jgi:hypothetical protein
MSQPDLTTPDPGPGPIPEDNLPGHHPPVEQDKPTGPPPRPKRKRRLTEAPKLQVERFDFRFEPVMQALALPFGVRPSNAFVEVDVEEVHIAFGPWHMRFPRADVGDVTETTGYWLPKVAGPPHLSFKDRGITFATNRERGLCMQLSTPHPGIGPLGLLKHPGATVTVADIGGLTHAIRRGR